MTVSTHVLDTERGAPAAGVRVELWRGERARRLGRDRRRRADRRARRHGPRHLPDRLPAAVAVLPPGRARGRARRGPLPHPAARLLVRVRDLPRKLTVEELAGLFEGRTRFVERLAELDDPLGRAREVAASLTDAEKKEVLDAHPAIGAHDALGAQRSRAGHRRSARARRAEPRVRGALRLPLRRLRQPAAEERDRPDPARAAERTREQELTTALDELVSIAEDRWRRS